PHRREQRIGALHPRRDDGRRAARHPDRPALPGVDLHRVPRPGHLRGLTGVRALDPRLLRRADAARWLVATDVALGLLAAVLVLAQATLIAYVVAQSFDGASLADVANELVALALVFAARGALACGFEVAGRRAAARCLSDLRLELAGQRLTRDPAA